MEIFKLHESIMGDYTSYIDSFINIKDEDISNKVQSELSSGSLWPKPLIQFNPSFQNYGDISELVVSKVLEPEIKDIFKGYKLYEHQVDAIKLGSAGKDFIVTSGTGSGKSLTYIGTVFNHLIKNKALLKPGVKAIIVYPMNALINSQTEEIKKYKSNYEKQTGKDFPITFGQYTGQENQESREEMKKALPDIILTNYMMLELLLSRDSDLIIKRSLYENLEFLVFDELHTYRGRQGSDVAMLVRRIKSQCKNEVTCIGTSATMISGDDTLEDQKKQVAAVAEAIFGKKFETKQIINETLSSSFGDSFIKPDSALLQKCIQTEVDMLAGEDVLKTYPTALWIEQRIALRYKENTLVRRKPMDIDAAVKELEKDSQLDQKTCKEHLEKVLIWISNVNKELSDQKVRHTYLPFKLHQFISQTGSVYVTLDEIGNREITLEPGLYSSADSKPLFPIVFSRTSGSSFACVRLNEKEGVFDPREFRESNNLEGEDEEDFSDGYLIMESDCWDPEEDIYNLPESWFNINKKGEITGPIKKRRPYFPVKVYYNSKGQFTYSESESHPLQGWFMAQRLLFDPTSGTTFVSKTSEGTKLTQLGSEGRATSTTISTFSILNRMAEAGYHVKDQKLLSFTDNRQDAALQAGHFNDYMQTIRLRAGIYKALVDAEDNTLNFSNLGSSIFKALDLPFIEFANMDTEPRFTNQRREYEEALQTYLVYRALYDLRRSWRVVLPNLEQCSLLNIKYKDLEEVVADDQAWSDLLLINSMSKEDRAKFIHNILDFFRLNYAIHSEIYLDYDAIQKNTKLITEKLRDPWKLDDGEDIKSPNFMRYTQLNRRDSFHSESIGKMSRLGRYIRGIAKKVDLQDSFSGEGYNEYIHHLMERLCEAGYLQSLPAKSKDGGEVKVYRLKIDTIQWCLGDGQERSGNIMANASYKEVKEQPNEFFKKVYQIDFTDRKKLNAADHTGQLTNDDRKDREEKFRAEYKTEEGKWDEKKIRNHSLSAMYCSPTMELGIDISNLSIVHMRNVPPNPANYAQRSGRAGRSGQAALVFTYCSSYSSHDRHYFKNAQDMVAGAVTAPRIDLNNEELLKTHLNALFLSRKGLPELRESLENLVDIYQGELSLKPEVLEKLRLSEDELAVLAKAFKRVIYDFKDKLSQSKYCWFNEIWINRNLSEINKSLENSLNRWHNLYRSAMQILNVATEKLSSGLYAVGSKENNTQKSNLYQAQKQIDLLRNDRSGDRNQLSEFYPYRYLAAEGFLPGYNFTRLPIRVFIPKGNAGEFIARPRTVALREFGPENQIYHAGNKYKIRQLIVQDTENHLKRAKVCKSSGYILMDEHYDKEICPFTQVSLQDNSDREIFLDLLEMSESRAVKADRISCEEEERVSQGYEVETYFCVDDQNMDRVTLAELKADGEHYLNMRFIPAARMLFINKKWRSRERDGFPLGMTSGIWKRQSSLENDKDNPDKETVRNVMLYTSDVADALYLEPIAPLGLEKAGVITLQYALKRAIENVFQVESSEIGVECMGGLDDRPNIFIYESAEGSLGILSRFVSNPEEFDRVIDEAISICRFEEDPEIPASYNDLLSYYNQRYHKDINRFKIQEALKKLKICKVEIQTNSSYDDYDDQYNKLLQGMDHNSSTEKAFLDYLYKNGFRLPDSAQKQVPGVYVQPDFFYEPDVHIFCDGTPHDKSEVRDDDRIKRQQLRSLGHKVFVYYYKDDLADLIASRPDIFKKVR